MGKAWEGGKVGERSNHWKIMITIAYLLALWLWMFFAMTVKNCRANSGPGLMVFTALTFVVIAAVYAVTFLKAPLW